MSTSRLKKEILELLEKDVEFRYAVAGYLGILEVLKRLDKHEEELAKLREDMNASFKRHDELFERQWLEIQKLREDLNKLREDMNRGFKRHDELFEKYWREIQKLREDMNAGFKHHNEVLEKHWNEIQRLREDMVAGFRRHDEILEKHWREIQKLREDMNRGFERHDELFEKHWREIQKLREDMNRGFKRHDEEIAKLRKDMIEGFRRVNASISRLSKTVERLTLTVEEEALDVVRYRLKNELGIDVKLSRIFIDGKEINIYGATRDLCIVGEATVRLGVRLIDELEEKIELLRRKRPDLLRSKIIKVIYVDYAPPSAVEEAKRRKIWLLKWSGDITPREILSL